MRPLSRLGGATVQKLMALDKKTRQLAQERPLGPSGSLGDAVLIKAPRLKVYLDAVMYGRVSGPICRYNT